MAKVRWTIAETPELPSENGNRNVYANAGPSIEGASMETALVTEDRDTKKTHHQLELLLKLHDSLGVCLHKRVGTVKVG